MCSVYNDTSILLYRVKHQLIELRIVMPSNFNFHCGGTGLTKDQIGFQCHFTSRRSTEQDATLVASTCIRFNLGLGMLMNGRLASSTRGPPSSYTRNGCSTARGDPTATPSRICFISIRVIVDDMVLRYNMLARALTSFT